MMEIITYTGIKYILINVEVDSKNLRDFLLESNIFNISIGENIDSLDMLLESLDLIKKITIVYKNKLDYSIISKMTYVEHIYIEDIGNSKVDLSSLSKLKYCNILASKNLKGIDCLINLNQLEIRKWKMEFGLLVLPKNLEKLDLINCDLEDLSLVSGINLNVLRIYYNSKLKKLSGINKMENLEKLEIYNCKNLELINEIQYCKKLKDIIFDNCPSLISILEISKLPLLNKVRLTGTTSVEDGNIKFLKDIENIFIVKRKHYDS